MMIAARVLFSLALTVILAAATSGCSDDNNKSPTTPTGVPSVAGSWGGQYRVKACTDTVNGAPGTLCATVLDSGGTTNPASMQPVAVTLTQQADQVGGTVTFSGWYPQSVPVTGMVGSSGRLWLQGTVAISDPLCPTVTGTFALSGWITDLNRQLNEAAGSFNFTGLRKTGATGCTFANVSVQADAVDIVKR